MDISNLPMASKERFEKILTKVKNLIKDEVTRAGTTGAGTT